MVLRFFRRRTAGDDVLRLERALAGARLELAERDRVQERLRGELARARGHAGDLADERAQADVERLVTAVGAPLVQFVTVAHLRGSDPAAGDLLAIGLRLVRALEREGVRVGPVGATVPFDPDRHEPLSLAGSPKRGDPVVVRVAGLDLRGKVLRKAGVEAVEG